MQSRLENRQQVLNRATKELNTAQQLNATLENDLATVQSESANNFPSGASVAGTYKSYAPSSYQFRRSGRASPTSSIVSGLNPREHMDGGGSSILPMITAQRDRFKKLNTQLSHELSETHKTVSSLRSEIASLQTDNFNLYEKIRYFFSHSRAGAATSGTGNLGQPFTLPFSSSSSQESALGRYSSSYESNLSPFATSRNLFATYCVVLHLLVFISLYWAAGAGDANIHKAAVGGMGGAGGGIAVGVQWTKPKSGR